MKCKQSNCDGLANFRYTWPGQDESHVCLICAHKLAGVARAMSMPLQLIPLTADDYMKHDDELEARAMKEAR